MTRLGFKAQLGFLILAAVADAVPFEHTQLSSTQIQAANAGLVLTDNYHALSRIWQQPGVSRTLDMLKKTRRNNVFKDNASPSPDDDLIVVDHIRAELNQVEYIMKKRRVQEFKCLDPYFGNEAPQDFCQFGPLFKGDFPSGKIDNQNLNISYLSGNYLNGDMGHAEQPPGHIQKENDGLDNLVNYAPLMETIDTTETASPILSFAMSRQGNRSYIAGEYATPLSKRNQSVSNPPSMIVDSETTINLFPPDIAAAINAAYVPGGTHESSMVWSVPCNAKPPALDIVIGGTPIRTYASSNDLARDGAQRLGPLSLRHRGGPARLVHPGRYLYAGDRSRVRRSSVRGLLN
ncbi:acid protease [Xylaria longipes]|nr:acid protease [Xylaria longipes]